VLASEVNLRLVLCNIVLEKRYFKGMFGKKNFIKDVLSGEINPDAVFDMPM
jgi:hypothetical protein